MISINGLSMPSPHALTVPIAKKGGISQYNALGQLVQEGMQDKRTVEITWRRMAGDQLLALSRVLAAGGFFTLIYPDPLSSRREMICCLKGQTARVWQYQQDMPQWADVQLILEEQ